jgi:hypothetical protein
MARVTRRPLPRRGDVAAILIVVVIAGVVLFGFTRFPDMYMRAPMDFGPGWECANAAKGRVCFKNPAETLAPPSDARPG